MEKEKTIKWLKAAGIRSIKTFAQTFVGTVGTSTFISQVDFRIVLSASILSALLSLMTSLAGLPELNTD